MLMAADTCVNRSYPSLRLSRALHYHPDMRDKIKAAAKDLFIRHGLGSLTLGEVADAVGISRPGIHYHFKTRTRLAEEVLQDYARANLDQSRAIWLDPKVTLSEKFARSLDFSRRRYLQYNPSGRGDRPWSLFARFYQESELMTPAMIAVLKNAAREQETYFGVAVEMAVVRAELVPDTPAAEVALQIVALVNQVGWLTWSSGSFSAVERLYQATLHGLARAYAVDGQVQVTRPTSTPTSTPRTRPSKTAASASARRKRSNST